MMPIFDVSIKRDGVTLTTVAIEASTVDEALRHAIATYGCGELPCDFTFLAPCEPREAPSPASTCERMN